jgi:hypothetical protein
MEFPLQVWEEVDYVIADRSGQYIPLTNKKTQELGKGNLDLDLNHFNVADIHARIELIDHHIDITAIEPIKIRYPIDDINRSLLVLERPFWFTPVPRAIIDPALREILGLAKIYVHRDVPFILGVDRLEGHLHRPGVEIVNVSLHSDGTMHFVEGLQSRVPIVAQEAVALHNNRRQDAENDLIISDDFNQLVGRFQTKDHLALFSSSRARELGYRGTLALHQDGKGIISPPASSLSAVRFKVLPNGELDIDPETAYAKAAGLGPPHLNLWIAARRFNRDMADVVAGQLDGDAAQLNERTETITVNETKTIPYRHRPVRLSIGPNNLYIVHRDHADQLEKIIGEKIYLLDGSDDFYIVNRYGHNAPLPENVAEDIDSEHPVIKTVASGPDDREYQQRAIPYFTIRVHRGEITVHPMHQGILAIYYLNDDDVVIDKNFESLKKPFVFKFNHWTREDYGQRSRMPLGTVRVAYVKETGKIVEMFADANERTETKKSERLDTLEFTVTHDGGLLLGREGRARQNQLPANLRKAVDQYNRYRKDPGHNLIVDFNAAEIEAKLSNGDGITHLPGYHNPRGQEVKASMAVEMDIEGNISAHKKQTAYQARIDVLADGLLDVDDTYRFYESQGLMPPLMDIVIAVHRYNYKLAGRFHEPHSHLAGGASATGDGDAAQLSEREETLNPVMTKVIPYHGKPILVRLGESTNVYLVHRNDIEKLQEEINKEIYPMGNGEEEFYLVNQEGTNVLLPNDETVELGRDHFLRLGYSDVQPRHAQIRREGRTIHIMAFHPVTLRYFIDENDGVIQENVKRLELPFMFQPSHWGRDDYLSDGHLDLGHVVIYYNQANGRIHHLHHYPDQYSSSSIKLSSVQMRIDYQGMLRVGAKEWKKLPAALQESIRRFNQGREDVSHRFLVIKNKEKINLEMTARMGIQLLTPDAAKKNGFQGWLMVNSDPRGNVIAEGFRHRKLRFKIYPNGLLDVDESQDFRSSEGFSPPHLDVWAALQLYNYEVARQLAAKSVSEPEPDAQADGAMVQDQENDLGGIDFNPQKFEIKKEGEGLQAPFNPPAAMNPAAIEGLYPVIINIVPVTNIPLILGVVDGAHEPLVNEKVRPYAPGVYDAYDAPGAS